MAVDSDWMLLMILARIFRNKESLKAACLDKELHDYSLYDKIGCIKTTLKQFYPEFFAKHETDLKELDKLRGMRNKFGHDKIDWIENKAGYIWISEAKKSGIFKNEYKISELMRELEEHRKSILSFLKTVELFIPKDE